MIPTLYFHHDTYRLAGHHLPVVNRQHETEKYPKSTFGYFTFYQYFCERDGTRTQTRPELDKDVVYKKAHENSITYCLAGHLDFQYPTALQVTDVYHFLQEMIQKYGITIGHVKYHRSYDNTSCPGKNIPAGYFKLLYICAKYRFSLSMTYSLLLILGGKLE